MPLLGTLPAQRSARVAAPPTEGQQEERKVCLVEPLRLCTPPKTLPPHYFGLGEKTIIRDSGGRGALLIDGWMSGGVLVD